MDISMDISMDLSMDIHIHGKPGWRLSCNFHGWQLACLTREQCGNGKKRTSNKQ